jgi:hypothetical protein
VLRVGKSIDAVTLDLARETASWDSIDVIVATDQRLLVAIGKNPPRVSHGSEHFIETADGQKYYIKSDGEPEHPRSVLLGYSDGKRCASVVFKDPPHQDEHRSITLTSTFMDEQLTGYVMRPEPLRFWYVGVIPLREAVLKAERIGSSRVAGRSCDGFLFSAVPGGNTSQDLVYQLDDATSMPLKVEAFSNQSRYKAGKPSWSWEAITLDVVQGYHVSLNSRYTGFIVKDDVASTTQLTEDYKVESITFNEKHPASAFWPTLQNGVFVNDLIAKKYYYNTPDKKAPVDTVAKTASPVVDPIGAAQPSDSTPWISGGVMLGVLLLVSAACMWIRRG